MFERRLIIYFIFILSVIIACQNSVEPDKQKEKEYTTLIYKIEGLLTEDYQLKDSTILGVEMWAATYFPEGDYTNFRTHTFQKWEYPKGLYIKVDSVYLGCERQMAVLFKKVQPTYYNPNRTNWMVYVMKGDTLLNLEDSLITFHWPDDTLNAVDKYWLLPY
ncbi:hypothetical protein ACX8XN_19205 [Calditrichota bacterium GD2]